MFRLRVLLLLCIALIAQPAFCLTLSPEERAWLAANPEVTLGIDPDWPPFEFRDSEQQYRGLTADYVRLIEKRLGITLKPVTTEGWSEVLTKAKTGHIQLLPGIMATPEREKYLAFTAPYLDFPIVIIANKSGAQPKSISDLERLRVGVVKDYAPQEILKANHPQLALFPQASPLAGLQALATGEIDAMVGDLASSVWNMNNSKIGGLNISAETPYRYQLSMAAPKDQTILIGVINRLLAELTPQEISALQEPWLGSEINPHPVWRNFLLYGLPVLLLACLILGSLLNINRRLRKEVLRNQTLESELRLSEQHFRSLVETLDAVTWEMLPEEDRFIYVSPQAEALFGYPKAEWFIPGFWQKLMPPSEKQLSLTQLYSLKEQPFYLRLRTAEGRSIWARCLVTPAQEGQQKLLRGLLIDMSESKQTEQALRMSEQKFASVFNNCPDIMVITRHLDGRIIATNKAFEEQIGFSSSEALGRTATEMGLWGIEGIGANIFGQLQSSTQNNLEIPFIRRNGERFDALLSTQPIEFGSTQAIVAIVRDISSLKDAQRKLELSERKFATAFRASPDGVLLTRMSDGLLLEVNQGFTLITGYSAEESIGKTTAMLGIWVEPASRDWLIQQVRARGNASHFQALIGHRNGEHRLCEISAQKLDINGEPCMLAIARDITESNLAQNKLRQAAAVFDSTSEAIMVTDLDQRITTVNRAFTRISGYSEEEATGQSPRILASGRHDSAFYVSMWHSLAKEGHWQGEVWNKRKNGEIFPSWLTINTVKDQHNEATHFVAVLTDISALK
jgi:PAS domain S-box-containing protein